MPGKLLVVLVGGVLGTIFWPGAAYALGCTASVSPNAVRTEFESSLTYSVTNDGPETATYAKVVSTDVGIFQLVSGNTSGWSTSLNGNELVFSGGALAGGVSANFTFTVDAVGEGTATIDMELSADGSSYEGCSGAGEVESSPDAPQPPLISGLTVSASSTSATIFWTTDVEATSTVNYGTTVSYGLSQSRTSASTSHAFTLSSLAASTTYYYKVSSVTSGGTREASSSFTTGAAGTTTVTTTAATVTAAAATPTPTPKVDRTPPVVTVATEFAKPFEKAPTVVGKASDDEELMGVEYSTDGGGNWLPVDEFDGKAEKKGEWAFTPQIREDGNYELIVRAKDKTGNVGLSKGLNLVIDRLPPRVGGALWSVGPFALTPEVDGAIVTVVGVVMKLTVGAVGGPTEITLEAHRDEELIKEYRLERSVDTGLWSAAVELGQGGKYKLEVVAVDGAGNETRRRYGEIEVLEPGRVEGGAGGMLEVFWKDPESGAWTGWDGETFGQRNSVRIDGREEYQLLLPAGTYYLEVKAPGYTKARSQIFDVNKITPINEIISLRKASSIRFGPWVWNWRWWETDLMKLSLGERRNKVGSKLAGERAPGFSLPATGGVGSVLDLRGEPGVVSFVNTWSPPGSEQIAVLDRLFYERQIEGVMVAPMESLAGAKVFVRRGGYRTGLVVDADGDWVEKYGLTTLPAHFALDRDGVVVDKIVGVLNRDELTRLVDGAR